jgi:hypothetical protein
MAEAVGDRHVPLAAASACVVCTHRVIPQTGHP